MCIVYIPHQNNKLKSLIAEAINDLLLQTPLSHSSQKKTLPGFLLRCKLT